MLDRCVDAAADRLQVHAKISMTEFSLHHHHTGHRSRRCLPRLLSLASCFWIFTMAGVFLGKTRARSNVLENLFSEYLRDEGQLTIEGRTITYKAYARDFSIPPVFDAEARDAASGIVSTAENFGDAQEAYQKAVANLLAKLQELGLMKKQTAPKRVNADSTAPIQEPKKPPEMEQGTKIELNVNQQELPEVQKLQETNPESDADPGQKNPMPEETKPEKNLDQDLPPEQQQPHRTNPESHMVPDKNIPGSEHEKNEDIELKQNPERELEMDPKPDDSEDTGREVEHKPDTDLTNSKSLNHGGRGMIIMSLSGIVGVITASMLYMKDWGILKTGAVIVGVFLLFKIASLKPQRIVAGCQRGVTFVLGLIKSTPNILTAVRSAGFVLDVFPDYQGSYTAYTIKQARPTSDMLSPKNTYQLWSLCKGLAFVLNNVEFNQGYDRPGAEIDQDNVVHLFKELGYKIILHNNLKGKEIMQSFQEFVAKFNQADVCYDSAVVVLMSHGNTGVILGTDGVHVKLLDLQRELEGDRCTALKGKPKMFFVQACRGQQTPAMPVVTDSLSTTRAGINAQMSINRYRIGIPRVEPDDLFSKLQDVADVHLAFATTDGYYSLRSEAIGSFFVQALCEVFFANAHQDNLDTLMNKVTDRVNRMKGQLYDPALERWILVNQTPECIKRMRRALYFLPKYARK